MIACDDLHVKIGEMHNKTSNICRI